MAERIQHGESVEIVVAGENGVGKAFAFEKALSELCCARYDIGSHIHRMQRTQTGELRVVFVKNE